MDARRGRAAGPGAVGFGRGNRGRVIIPRLPRTAIDRGDLSSPARRAISGRNGLSAPEKLCAPPPESITGRHRADGLADRRISPARFAPAWRSASARPRVLYGRSAVIPGAGGEAVAKSNCSIVGYCLPTYPEERIVGGKVLAGQRVRVVFDKTSEFTDIFGFVVVVIISETRGFRRGVPERSPGFPSLHSICW